MYGRWVTVNKKTKKTLITLGAILTAFVLVLVGYLSYVLISYSRIEDKTVLIIENSAEQSLISLDKDYTIITQNIGFGAYTSDFTFFMDGGEESWAESEESVKECVDAAITKIKTYNPDFILFQEVDTDSTRSYHINEKDIINSAFYGYTSVFANNYHSAFLFWPPFEPHGASNSGMITLSKFQFVSSIRRSLPISEGLSKFLDLDRCYSVSRAMVEGGKELVIYNVHSSAYGGSDEIRTAQMTMLFNDMKSEYEKGNYVVCGGDFNHDFTGDSTQKLNNVSSAEYGWAQPFPDDLLPDCLVKCTGYTSDTLTPTCRNCDIPYSDASFTLVVDGFIVSDNVSVGYLENIKTDFTYSDHNPVVMKFKLN